MPIETLKCQECGSAEVTEFKPETYVCGHCESVFKSVNAEQSPSCGCGTFAIGRCAQCGVAVCGEHSRLVGQRLLCDAHSTDPVWAKRMALAMREKRRGEQQRGRQAEAEQALRNIPDPYERLCVLILQRFTSAAAGTGSRFGWTGTDLAAVCPELWESPPVADDLENRPPWDSAKVAAWFARRAQEIGVPPDEMFRLRIRGRTLLGKPKWLDGAPIPCWRFHQGSTQRSGLEMSRETALVLADGRVLSVLDFHEPSVGNLAAYALAGMAGRLGAAPTDGH